MDVLDRIDRTPTKNPESATFTKDAKRTDKKFQDNDELFGEPLLVIARSSSPAATLHSNGLNQSNVTSVQNM